MKAPARKIETIPALRLSHFAVCGLIVLLIGIVFGQTLSYDFVNYDDKTYIYGNSLVSSGLSLHGLLRAFVDTQTNNWHPLTLVSHMIDCQLYDLKPGGHHFTNVFLHTMAAVLLFFWLRNITGKGQSGSDWTSAFVTALFAIHPLRVESVAWIAERKDVLSAVFFFLTLGAYVRYARTPSSVGQLPFGWRLQNALVTYLTYIWQMFWPANLAVFYPHPDDRLALWQVTLAAALLVAMTWVAVALRRGRPYLLVGWLWYLIMLLPVIGIAEVGLQGHADRYTYLPQIGLYIALTWLAADVARGLPHRKEILAIVGGGIVIILSACAWKQTTYWRDSETLWTRALAVTTDNGVDLNNLSTLLMERGQLADALSYFQTALAARSRSEHRHHNLSLALIHDSVGNVLARKGRLNDAIAHFRQAIELRPDFPDAHYNLGTALFQKGDLDGAIAQWRTTLSIHPYDSGAHTSLGNALVQKGLLREAVDHYERALQSDPDSILPLNNLAWVMSTGPDDSLRNNEVAVQLATKANQLSKESNPVFIRTLAAAYAQAGQFEKAIETARRASEQANAQGAHDLAVQIREDVDLYQRRTPFRDPSLRNAR